MHVLSSPLPSPSRALLCPVSPLPFPPHLSDRWCAHAVAIVTIKSRTVTNPRARKCKCKSTSRAPRPHIQAQPRAPSPLAPHARVVSTRCPSPPPSTSTSRPSTRIPALASPHPSSPVLAPNSNASARAQSPPHLESSRSAHSRSQLTSTLPVLAIHVSNLRVSQMHAIANKCRFKSLAFESIARARKSQRASPRSQVRGSNPRARKFDPALLNSPRSQTQVPADAYRLRARTRTANGGFG
ncbi:hypothetical protein DFH09DRAFT_1500785 [Mycena vulgaris]|nr:hypothetical protein DFH09DRAFT_1500785 [Mycena vulgaris]